MDTAKNLNISTCESGVPVYSSCDFIYCYFLGYRYCESHCPLGDVIWFYNNFLTLLRPTSEVQSFNEVTHSAPVGHTITSPVYMITVCLIWYWRPWNSEGLTNESKLFSSRALNVSYFVRKMNSNETRWTPSCGQGPSPQLHRKQNPPHVHIRSVILPQNFHSRQMILRLMIRLWFMHIELIEQFVMIHVENS